MATKTSNVTARVEPEVKDSVIDEFFEICMAQKFISEGGIDYARDVLDKAFGGPRADELIMKLSSALKLRRTIAAVFLAVCGAITVTSAIFAILLRRKH